MKKLLLLFIPFLMLIFVSSCTETPTENLAGVEIENSEDLYQIYLKKKESIDEDMSFERFKYLVEKSRSLSKSVNNILADPVRPPGWEDGGDPENPDYGIDIGMGPDDDGRRDADIGFTFEFFGETYTDLVIHANGFLAFGKSQFNIYRRYMPMYSGIPVIAVLMSDVYTPDGGVIYKKLVGTEVGERVFVVTWVDAAIYPSTEPNTFQVQLHESGKIQFSYMQLNVTGTEWDDTPQEIGLSPNNNAEDVIEYFTGAEVAALTGNSYCIDPADYTDNVDGSCSGGPPPVTPVDSYAEVNDARYDLQAMLDGVVLEKKLKKALEHAIKDIDKSLDPKNWLADLSGPDPKKGKKIFDHLKKAVKDLKKFRKAKGAGLEDKLEVERIIMELVLVCQGFAQSALDVLEPLYCSTGKCGKERGKALNEMAKAEEELAKDHWDHAIDKYKKAWEHALKALKHYESP